MGNQGRMSTVGPEEKLGCFCKGKTANQMQWAPGTNIVTPPRLTIRPQTIKDTLNPMY